MKVAGVVSNNACHSLCYAIVCWRLHQYAGQQSKARPSGNWSMHASCMQQLGAGCSYLAKYGYVVLQLGTWKDYQVHWAAWELCHSSSGNYRYQATTHGVACADDAMHAQIMRSSKQAPSHGRREHAKARTGAGVLQPKSSSWS